MKYVIITAFIFSSVFCIGMASAVENFTEDGKEKDVEVLIFDGKTGPTYSPQAADQPPFEINFTVNVISSYPTLAIALTPEFYGIKTITETDIVSWQWSFSDGRQDYRTTMVPISADFGSPGEYVITLTACTRENICETKAQLIAYIHEKEVAHWKNSLMGVWQNSVAGIVLCPFSDSTLTLPPTPAVTSIPTKNPTIQFSTIAAPTLFQAGPAYVYPNTAVQLQVLDLEYDIVQIQWEYGDGTSSGWVPAERNKKTSHTYKAPGVYRPVVTVRNPTLAFQLSSEDIDEHVIVVYDRQIIDSVPQVQTGSAYIVTYPKGIDISIVGQCEGTSDLMITTLPVGTYDVMLKREGFQDWYGQIEIFAQKTVMQVYHYDKYPMVTTDVFNQADAVIDSNYYSYI